MSVKENTYLFPDYVIIFIRRVRERTAAKYRIDI